MPSPWKCATSAGRESLTQLATLVEPRSPVDNPEPRQAATLMNYLWLVYLDPEHWSACSDQVCMDFVFELQAQAVYPTARCALSVSPTTTGEPQW